MKNRLKIIAEAGVNHNGSVIIAKKLAWEAKRNGADFIKFQIFKTDEQISKSTPTANYQKKNSNEKNMYSMAKSYELSLNEHKEIKKYCSKINIQYLASCFDVESFNYYRKYLNKKIVKIGSGEITNYGLLKEISKTNISVILSTGMSFLEEIKKALIILKNNKVTLLHCTSEYPTKYDNVNLNSMLTLKKVFNTNIGLSDHTIDSLASISATALGAKIIEKHFTINKSLKGPDHKMSLNPKELKDFVNKIKYTEKILGTFRKKPTKQELQMRKFARRGIVAKKKIKKGEKISLKNIVFKRPSTYIPAEKANLIIGKKVLKNISIDKPIKFRYLKK
jgi:N,N'-diacetyllegionaminate synthase